MTAPVKRTPIVLGPGSLTFGEIGVDGLDISCQVTSIKIAFDSDKEDDVPTLCGDVIVGEKTYTAKLEASAGQDLEVNGIIDWSWKNAGKQVPFTFTPITTSSAVITGQVVIDPIEFGGDVKKRNLSEFEFDCVGLPTFTPDSTPPEDDFPPLG